MKTRKFNKKMTLNKKTVAHLNNDNMNRLKGGEETQGFCSTNRLGPACYCDETGMLICESRPCF